MSRSSCCQGRVISGFRVLGDLRDFWVSSFIGARFGAVLASKVLGSSWVKLYCYDLTWVFKSQGEKVLMLFCLPHLW